MPLNDRQKANLIQIAVNLITLAAITALIFAGVIFAVCIISSFIDVIIKGQ